MENRRGAAGNIIGQEDAFLNILSSDALSRQFS
jgi:hypothetical protein